MFRRISSPHVLGITRPPRSPAIAGTVSPQCWQLPTAPPIEQVNHFGGWAGVYGRTGARQLKKSMALRYCGRRAEPEREAKCEHWHMFRMFMDGVVYPTRAGAPTSHQVSWEMLAQVAATLVSDDGHIPLDAARQEEVTLAAACGARGYLCPCNALSNSLGRSDSG